MSSYYREPRLSVRITEDHDDRLRVLLCHGDKVKVFTALVAQLVDILEKSEPRNRQLVIGAIASGHIGIGYNNLSNFQKKETP